MTTGAKGEGGTDSGNTSRASTPVSDRSVKVSWYQIFIFHLARSKSIGSEKIVNLNYVIH